MGLTNERKVFLGVLTLASAALIIDQGILAPNGAAGMESIPADAEQQLPPGNAQPDTQHAPVSPARMLISRLNQQQSMPPTFSLGEAFSLGQLLPKAEEPTPESSPNERSVRTPTLPVIDTPAPDLPSLTAVMPAKDGGGALLNGKIIRIGQSDANGFVLMQVRERGVVLKRDDRLYTLEVPTPRAP